jgi:hypothetical protein
MKQVWQRCKSAVLCLLSLLAVFTVLNLLGVGCPIQYVTGISCPDCGMTRALWCLITLRFADALAYHPLCVAMPPVFALLALCTFKRRPRAQRVLLYATAAALVAVWILRLCTGDGDVVVFAPQNGLIGRVLSYLIQ